MTLKLRDFYDRYGDELLGVSAPDLYELQRELQHLPGFPRGRPGPGGGADATADALTMIVAATLAGGARRQTRQTTPATLELPYCADDDGRSDCGLTSTDRFGNALHALLSDADLASRVRQVIVCRDWAEAAIAWEDGGTIRESRFAGADGDRCSRAAEKHGTLFGLARLGGAALREIAGALD